MRMYYGTRISPNKVESAEGYLLCLNVPIARTGEQEYYGRELGLQDRAGELITVHRPDEEVFAPATIASFEGQPVTNEHPVQDVDANNAAGLMKGFSMNVRRGNGDDSNKLLADLKITDPTLIAEIKNGKIEVSCGYDCTYTEQDDGSYIQSDIRGNHIAIVTAGRAGHDVAIRDSLPPVANIEEKDERSKQKMTDTKKHGLWGLFARAAKDAAPEELAEMAELISETEKKGKDADEEAEEIIEVETEDDGDIYDLLREVLRKLDEVLGMNKHEEHEDENGLEALEREIGGDEEEKDDDEVKVIEPEEVEIETEDACGKINDAAILASIRALKPVIAAIPEKQVRDAATAELAKALRQSRKTADYDAIVKTTADNAAKKGVQDADFRSIEALYNARDPHRKENK